MVSMRDRETVVLNVRVPPETLGRVDEIAERLGVDRTRAVQACLATGLEDAETFAGYCENEVSGLLLLVGARAVRGREGYEKVERCVRAAREWRRKREQAPLPFAELEGGGS